MNKNPAEFFEGLPGAELVVRGLANLTASEFTEEALLVLVAAPRLRRLGIVISEISVQRPFEHRLYELLEERYGHDAYSRYNSLLRRIISFSRALERERAAKS